MTPTGRRKPSGLSTGFQTYPTVTGSNTGIGKETVRALLSKNTKVYIASHNKARVDAAIEKLEATTGKKARSSSWTSPASVRSRLPPKFSKGSKRRSRVPTLNNLLFCRGAMNPPADAVISGGYDLQFGLSVVVDGIRWETLEDGPERHKFKVFDLYNQSKFANVVLA
ncbi:hypothetical protein K438DRAFT_1769642 [Mycena galopus ATCC 62051]|nr:hypothetical protein K438DRAFT_1769642 [Mycena galopus ATCC 62051]